MAAYINNIPVSERIALPASPSKDLLKTPICTNELSMKQLYAYFASMRRRHKKQSDEEFAE